MEAMLEGSDRDDSLSRRGPLAQAVGAISLMSALDRAAAQTGPRASPSPTRETFDFGWKFNKGDAPGAHSAIQKLRQWWSLILPEAARRHRAA
jgi:hypothetical protein